MERARGQSPLSFLRSLLSAVEEPVVRVGSSGRSGQCDETLVWSSRASYRRGMADWWSIEVMDGDAAAAQWHLAFGDSLVGAAVQHGVLDWNVEQLTWGVVLELRFPDEADWLRFLAEPAVRAALDAAPDPVHGVLTYRGRGGSSGSWEPRRPRPLIGAGSAALPIPAADDVVRRWDHDLVGVGVDGGGPIAPAGGRTLRN